MAVDTSRMTTSDSFQRFENSQNVEVRHVVESGNRSEQSETVERLERVPLLHNSPRGQSGMQAVTVISTRRSGEFNITSTVVLAGLLVGKNLAYSSL
jgi:hypothetical protein